MGGERWPSPSWWTNSWFHWSILFLFFFSLCFWCCFSLLGVCQYIPLVLQASLMKIIIQKKKKRKRLQIFTALQQQLCFCLGSLEICDWRFQLASSPSCRLDDITVSLTSFTKLWKIEHFLLFMKFSLPYLAIWTWFLVINNSSIPFFHKLACIYACSWAWLGWAEAYSGPSRI